MLLQIQWDCYEIMFIFCLSPCGWCRTRRVMVEQAENIWACSRIFRRLRHQWLAETFASTARGLSWFLWVRTATNNVSWKEHTTLLYLFYNDNSVISLILNKKSALSASSAWQDYSHADFADYADNNNPCSSASSVGHWFTHCKVMKFRTVM